MKAKRIGNTIVAFIGFKFYSKEFTDSEEREKVYERLLNYDPYDPKEVEEIKLLFAPSKSEKEIEAEKEFEKRKEETKNLIDILDFMKDIRDNGHELFEVIDNSIYLKGIKATLPELLIREFIKAQEDDNKERIKALINFWSLCAMNPDPRPRFDLFKFLKNHKLSITPFGHFIAYRTVNVYKDGDAKLEKFVTQEWLKVKRWKKSPKNYNIHKWVDGSYGIMGLANNEHQGRNDKSFIGNLDDLYHNIGNISGNVYTDAHTGKFRIKMGEPVRMDRNNIDPDPKNACSIGLHLGNEAFMKANMGYFGKVGIVCLVNPRHVTSVPEYDSGKMRTCEYLPIAIAETDENGKIVPVDVDVFDYEYAENTLEEIEAMSKLSSSDLEEYKKHEFIAAEVDYTSLYRISANFNVSLEEANKIIKERVVKV